MQCDNLTVPGRGSITITIDATSNVGATGPSCGRKITNTASSSAAGDASADVSTTPCAPNLTLSKSAVDADGDAMTSVAPGGSYFYELVVSNTGTAQSAAVTLTENDAGGPRGRSR